MQTLKQVLENLYLNKKVKITIGHPSNDQHITATCIGFKDGYGDGTSSFDWRDKIYILLDDIKSDDKWLKYPIESGQFDKHYFRLDTEIELLREENINQLLENK